MFNLRMLILLLIQILLNHWPNLWHYLDGLEFIMDIFDEYNESNYVYYNISASVNAIKTQTMILLSLKYILISSFKIREKHFSKYRPDDSTTVIINIHYVSDIVVYIIARN